MRLQLIMAAAAGGMLVTGPAVAEPRWRFASDTLVYADSDHVVVVSPQVGIHLALDDDGGEASALAVVDAITAASVDVVSQATSGFDEVRTEASLGVSKAIAGWLPQASYRISHEPDYDSQRVRLGLQRSFAGKDTTAAAGYALTFDEVGMAGTPRERFAESLRVHAADASLTQVMDRNTLGRAAYTLTVQDGYMEKPYRLVPLFDDAGIAAAMADSVPLDLTSFDRYRLSVRPPEEVPDRRVGHAMSLRLMRFFAPLAGSLRIDYQFYLDTWGLRAHLVEPAVQSQLSRRLTLVGLARLYHQSGADFWQRTYVVSSPDMLPRWRTLDRDLSPYQNATVGARMEWSFASLRAYVEASSMFTHYDEYLFLTWRTALIGQLGVRWTP